MVLEIEPVTETIPGLHTQGKERFALEARGGMWPAQRKCEKGYILG